MYRAQPASTVRFVHTTCKVASMTVIVSSESHVSLASSMALEAEWKGHGEQTQTDTLKLYWY